VLGNTYTVKEGGVTVATGKFVKLHDMIHPYGGEHKLPAAQIESFTQSGVYGADKYTFEEVKAPSLNPAGIGLNAVRALRKEVGRGRKTRTRKHKRRARSTRDLRSRKTRRRHK
jgi:hypothetical protein